MENTYKLSLSLATPLTSLVLYVTNSTLVPEAIRCCLQTSSYCCFYQHIICTETFVHKTYFLSYMDAYIAIILYCQRLFLLFTGKQHCLH